MTKVVTNRFMQAILMILASGAVFMDYLDTCIVSIALPEIARSTSMTSAGSSWVLTSYLLALGGCLLIFGKIADKTGRYKSIFVSGFFLFTIASFFCGFSDNMVLLIIFRVLQGFAAAMMVATATMLVTLHLPERKQGFATGVIATAGGVAMASGPFVGGIITEFISWHWIFFINIPIGIIGVILGILVIPKFEKSDVVLEKKPFDYLGSILLVTSLILLITGIEVGSSYGWSWYLILMIIASPIFMLLFVRHELKHPDPVMSVKLLFNRTIMFASLSTLLITAVYIGMIYIMPFLLIGELGLNISAAGLIMLFPALSMAVIGIPSGALTRKFGCMKLCTVAALILTIGMIVLTVGVFISSFAMVFVGIVLTGLGAGINEAPSIRRINIHSPVELQGSSGGLVFSVMNIGCVIGVAMFSSAASIVSGSADFVSAGIAVSCIVGAAAAFIAFVFSAAAKDDECEVYL
ncbi:MAG TPA: MFS transporter [Methanocorpusculum sp.]|nr:MFS transporter [Methanocorpusculum sp.]